MLMLIASVNGYTIAPADYKREPTFLSIITVIRLFSLAIK